MSLIAIALWITTAGGGLHLLSIWLIEYDKDFQSVAETRLPPVVLTCHVLLAGGGLLVWAGYLIFDEDRLAWTAVVALCLAATLGIVMAVRWVGVYRASRTRPAIDVTGPGLARAQLTLVSQSGSLAVAERPPPLRDGPPERNFPLPVVIAHGAFAAATLTFVLLTAFGVGGS
ncbi:MAG: hypothetical protein ACLQFR_04310 [Streptosporangiaceae bacterium]